MGMPFPRRLLTEDEEVVVEIRPHWAFLGKPLVTAVAVVALSIAVTVAFSDAPPAVLYVLLVLVACSALWLVGRLDPLVRHQPGGDHDPNRAAVGRLRAHWA